MTKDADIRVIKLVQQLDLETHKRKLAERQTRALRLHNARLKAALTTDRATKQEKPAAKPPA
jgi:hypothetical protein